LSKRVFSGPHERIILALDVDNISAAREAVTLLKGHVGAFKIGFELFVSEGPAVVGAVKDLGGRVFLDLKFHDIPNTVAKAARAAVRMGVDFFDVHASGGRAMMSAASEAAGKEAEAAGIALPVSLAVTVLTSLGADDLRNDLNISNSPEAQVVSLARLAKSCGMGGVVASPREIKAIRDAVGEDFVIVTPGVRPAWSDKADQKRVATPAEAVASGADYLVIGRPILSAKDPVEAAVRIKNELYGISLA
jgi:orotidine-5'-phosphate decarboxylase